MKKVNVDVIINYLNNEFSNSSICKDDFKDGDGVYGILFSSRGEIEEIYKVEGEFKLRSKEELIEEMMFDNDEDEREYYEEFVGSGEIDYNDFGGLVEMLNEEESIEYYNIVV